MSNFSGGLIMKRIWWGIAFLIILISLFLGFSNLIINIQWFKEVGYLQVYFTKLMAILKLMVPISIVIFISLFIYVNSMKKKILKYISIESSRKFNKIINWIILITSVFIGYVVASNYWYRILQFTNSENFGIKDPIFKNDISFYIFKLPLIESLYGIVLTLLLLIVAITFATYVFIKTKNKIIDMTNWKINRNDILKSFASKQLAIAAFFLVLVIAVGYLLKSYNLLYRSKGLVFGALYTDIKVTLLFYRIIIIVCIISSFIVLISLLKGKFKPVMFIATIIVFLIILEPIASLLVQQFVVKSNEMDVEKPYIANNIEATRHGFNIDNIEEKSFEPKQNLDNYQLIENKDIISNLKVNSINPVINFYNQVQVLKQYYNFNDIDTDRYNINGKYTQVFISPRELDYSSITTWQNKYLRYTHGYGVVMSKVNSVTTEGQPDFVMRDIPTENTTDIKIDNPRIYFGEGSNEYVVVNTGIEEFDYPQGSENKTYKYTGTAGLSMNILNRILVSFNEGNIRLLLSRDINSNSKILLNRNIVERVKKIAPFLTYDSDPYIVVNEGRLMWVIDAYTTSNRYPYSQQYNNINYVRNSIKVIVDAYNGNVDFYIVDKKDPIAVSYQKIFKGLIKDGNTLPQNIKDHFRYPQDLFKVQCDVFGKYHMTNPTLFFTQEDLWEVSSNIVDVEGKETSNEALYLMTKLPGEKNVEMMLFEYFNMKGKQNMVSLLGARMDSENYGKMILYKFPTKKTILSPYLLKNKILADPDISKEISLWQGKGSKVEYGDTVIIPINNSLFYLETIYLKADVEKSLPEVRKIILSDGEKIVGAETVDKALELLFDYNSQNLNKTEEQKQSENIKNENKASIQKANELYDKALEAQKAGDWAKYGEYIKQLGEILKEISK